MPAPALAEFQLPERGYLYTEIPGLGLGHVRSGSFRVSRPESLSHHWTVTSHPLASEKRSKFESRQTRESSKW